MTKFQISIVFGFLSLCLIGGCSSDGSSQSAAVGPPTPKISADFETRFQFAQIREQKGEFQAARKIYRELLESAPNHARLHHRLGIISSRLGEPAVGFEHLAHADAANPDNPEILNDLGYACVIVGRYDQAQQVLITALELEPNNERALNNLGLAYGHAGKLEKAFQTFRKVMPEAEALSNLGYIAAQIGRTDFAIECYSQALTINPKLTEAGEALAQLADVEDSIKRRRRIAEVSRKTSKVADRVVNAENDSRDAATTGIRQASSEQPIGK